MSTDNEMTQAKKAGNTDEVFAKKRDEALKRIAEKMAQRPQQDEQKGGVLARLNKIKTKPDDENQGKDKAPKAKDGKPLSLAELAKQDNENAKKLEKEGITRKEPTSKDIEDKDKKKDKEKDKEHTPEKQEQIKREAASKISLPSGLEIHQHGPAWVLVSKDGKVEADITDVMNAIDKFNRNVDEVNQTNRVKDNAEHAASNVASNNPDLKNRGNEISGGDDRLTSAKVDAVAEILPNIKDANGEQLIKPEDVKAVAEAGIKASMDGAFSEKVNEELKKRDKNNQNTAEDRAKQAAYRHALDKQRSGGR